MPTEKPRVTITMSQEQLSKIDEYRFGHKIKNQLSFLLLTSDSPTYFPNPTNKKRKPRPFQVRQCK